MRGYKEKNQLGLIPLSVYEIFRHIKADKAKEYRISVSYLEIYNECVNDLITPANQNLEVRESIEGILINRLTELKVKDAKQILEIMEAGDEARNVAETKLNETSSRSHTVFRINIAATVNSTVTLSQLNLVDLAGSEGVGKT